MERFTSSRAWGPLSGRDIKALADLPVGALGHLVRAKLDPLWRLSADLPDLADELRELYPDPEFDGGDTEIPSGQQNRIRAMAEDALNSLPHRHRQAVRRVEIGR